MRPTLTTLAFAAVFGPLAGQALAQDDAEPEGEGGPIITTLAIKAGKVTVGKDVFALPRGATEARSTQDSEFSYTVSYSVPTGGATGKALAKQVAAVRKALAKRIAGKTLTWWSQPEDIASDGGGAALKWSALSDPACTEKPDELTATVRVDASYADDQLVAGDAHLPILVEIRVSSPHEELATCNLGKRPSHAVTIAITNPYGKILPEVLRGLEKGLKKLGKGVVAAKATAVDDHTGSVEITTKWSDQELQAILGVAWHALPIHTYDASGNAFEL